MGAQWHSGSGTKLNTLRLDLSEPHFGYLQNGAAGNNAYHIDFCLWCLSGPITAISEHLTVFNVLSMQYPMRQGHDLAAIAEMGN